MTLTRSIREERLNRLETDGRVSEAAYVAYTFHLDPAVIAAETDPVKALIRLAAARLVNNELRRRDKERRN